MVVSPKDSDPRETVLQGPAAYIKDRPIRLSERVPHKNKTINIKPDHESQMELDTKT
jgi:hypothetical protein